MSHTRDPVILSDAYIILCPNFPTHSRLEKFLSPNYTSPVIGRIFTQWSLEEWNSREKMALKILWSRESVWEAIFHPCLARSAWLKKHMFLKPSPQSSFLVQRMFQSIQWIFLWSGDPPQKNLLIYDSIWEQMSLGIFRQDITWTGMAWSIAWMRTALYALVRCFSFHFLSQIMKKG